MSDSPVTLFKLTGLILGGGRSSRMGYDKSTIVYHTKPQREFLFELLQHYCLEVFYSCKRGADIPAHLNPLPDSLNIESPLNGIMTALEHRPERPLLTVPVDMPSITIEVIEELIKNRNISSCATCFYDSNGKYPEPLVAIWEPGTLPLLKKYQGNNRISPREFLIENQATLIRCSYPDFYLNINSKEELDRFKKERQ